MYGKAWGFAEDITVTLTRKHACIRNPGDGPGCPLLIGIRRVACRNGINMLSNPRRNLQDVARRPRRTLRISLCSAILSRRSPSTLPFALLHHRRPKQMRRRGKHHPRRNDRERVRQRSNKNRTPNSKPLLTPTTPAKRKHQRRSQTRRRRRRLPTAASPPRLQLYASSSCPLPATP